MKELRAHFFPNCSYWQVGMSGSQFRCRPKCNIDKKKIIPYPNSNRKPPFKITASWSSLLPDVSKLIRKRSFFWFNF